MEPSRNIPYNLYSQYTMNETIPILDLWYDGRNDLKAASSIWSKEYVEKFKNTYTPQNIKDKAYLAEPYGGASGWLLKAFENHNVKNKRVAVIGSLTPWIEAILLNLDNIVTTVEYNVPVCNEVPNLNAISYADFCASDTVYDAIVTYSSIEHSGLGRYGDELNPNGDLETMEQIHKHLNKNGVLVWGAPVGHDALVWNAHRIYGRIRLPIMFRQFKEIEWIDFDKENLLDLPLQNNSVNAVVVLSPLI